MSRLLRHWIVAVPVMLAVAALAILQIDDYTMGADALGSLVSAGWLQDRAFSSTEVLDSLSENWPDQAPLYFLALNQWGHLLGRGEIALARLPAVFCGLLSLACVYRLGRDALSPLAGAFALVIMASNAFFNFYYAHIRFYPQLVLLSTLVIWLFLRLAVMRRGGLLYYGGLAAACAALVSTQAFGILIYIVCSLYHLVYVPKDRRWLKAVAAALAGLILAGPLIFSMLTTGVEFAQAFHGRRADGPVEILATWLFVTANGSPGLFVLVALGAVTGWRRGLVSVRLFTRLFLLLLLGIALLTVIGGTLDVGLMRHLLPAFPIAVLFQAAGLYALYRERKWFGALLCLWVITGLAFAGSAVWHDHIQGRIISYELPPWHRISRVARQSAYPAQVIAFMLPEDILHYGAGAAREYWFHSRDVDIRIVGSARWLEEYLHRYEGARHLPWLSWQTSLSDEADLAGMAATMDALGYRECQRVSLPVATEMAQYSWISLDCQPARLTLSAETDSLRYEYYGAQLSPGGSWLMLANKWTWLDDAPRDDFRISLQLIDDDWRNVAQVDADLTANAPIRQFGMDVGAVPAGCYRLMAMIYRAETGERLAWRRHESQMLELAAVCIPET